MAEASSSSDQEDWEDAQEDCSWDLPDWSADAFDLARELESNSRLQQQDLEELSAWARRQRGLPRMHDAALVKFLHSCRYDVLAAEQCINFYWRTRLSTPALFQGRDVRRPAVRAQADVLDFVVVPRLTPDGCRVLINGLKDPDPCHYEFEEHVRLLLMAMDALLLAEPCLPGVYVVYDMHLGLLSHFWKFGFFTQRKLITYLQAALPMVVKGTILLHTPAYINTVMKMFKTIGDRKRMDETIMLEGDDYTELYKLIPKNCLPSDYGGTLPSRKELHELTIQRLDSLRDYFAEEDAALTK